MLASLCKLCDRNNQFYTCEDFAQDCSEKATFCVLVDASKRDTRFCGLNRVDQTEPDFWDCGFENEMEFKSPEQYRRAQTRRFIRWLLIIQVCVWGVVGVMALVYPHSIVFNVVISDEYSEHFRVMTHHQLALADQQAAADILAAQVADDSSVIGSLLNKIFSAADTTAQDKAAVMSELQESAFLIAKMHPEMVAMTMPTQIVGACYLFFAIMSAIMRLDDFSLVPSIATPYILWFVTSAVGMAVASAGRGEGMASSNFTFTMLGLSVLGAFVWFGLRERLTSILQQAPPEVRDAYFAGGGRLVARFDDDDEERDLERIKVAEHDASEERKLQRSSSAFATSSIPYIFNCCPTTTSPRDDLERIARTTKVVSIPSSLPTLPPDSSSSSSSPP